MITLGQGGQLFWLGGPHIKIFACYGPACKQKKILATPVFDDVDFLKIILFLFILTGTLTGRSHFDFTV